MSSDQSIAAELERVLRDITGVPDLALASEPQRMTGGFDTDTYAFSLDNAPDVLSGGLILRHYRRPDETHRVLAETAIQSVAAAAGHAVPAVPIDSVGATIAGRPFIVMRRLSGTTLLDVLSEDPMGALEPAGRLMGRTQARLHNLDATGAVSALESTGLDTGTYTPFKLLADIKMLADATGDTAIQVLFNWLEDQRPDPPDELSVCHGDFHPANILVEDMKLTGVIDWGNYSFGHSEYDVAVTQFIVTIGPLDESPVPIEQLRAMLDAFLAVYKGEYLEHRPINDDLVDYYIVLRAGHALAKVVAAREGSNHRGVAHDGYSWSRPLVYEHVRELIRDRTGVDGGPLEA